MLSLTQAEFAGTTSVKRQLFESFKDRNYRSAFVQERVRSSIALQIRALREQRNKMTQTQLGNVLGMAQTWVSILENPEYGKMTVATLLRLAGAFDADLEIKFRPFSATLCALPAQGSNYFSVPSFEEERSNIENDLQREEATAVILTTEKATLLGIGAGSEIGASLSYWDFGWQGYGESPFSQTHPFGMTMLETPMPDRGHMYSSSVSNVIDISVYKKAVNSEIPGELYAELKRA